MNNPFLNGFRRRASGIMRLWPAIVASLLLVAAVLAVASAAQAGPGGAVLAQSFDLLRNKGSGGGTDFIDFDNRFVKALLLLLVFLAALVVFFQTLFPFLLKRDKPWWPLTAYGFSMALVLTVTLVLGMWIFWQDMAFGKPPRTVTQEWGLRIALIAVGVSIVLIVLSRCRSSAAASAGK